MRWLRRISLTAVLALIFAEGDSNSDSDSGDSDSGSSDSGDSDPGLVGSVSNASSNTCLLYTSLRSCTSLSDLAALAPPNRRCGVEGRKSLAEGSGRRLTARCWSHCRRCWCRRSCL